MAGFAFYTNYLFFQATSSGFVASGAASSSHLVSAAGAAAPRVDIDALTAHDPIQFTDYAADIHKHYKRVEVR